VVAALFAATCDDAGPSVVDSACGVATDRTGPFPLSIEFRNDGVTPLFLHTGCVGLEYGLSSCAGAYRDTLGPTFTCGCSCADASCTSSVVCGACPAPSSQAVAPGEAFTASWAAEKVSLREGATHQCVAREALPAAHYRIAVDVYDDAQQAATGGPGRLVVVDFTLPMADDKLVVDLGTVAAACDASPDSPAGTCRAGAMRETPCDLATSLSWAWPGGLALSTDEVTLAPPNVYTRTRTFSSFSTAAGATASCTARLARCSLDARVPTTADLAAALLDADVVAAFSKSGMLVYGEDARAYDGTVLWVSQGAGSFVVGPACDPASAVSGLCQRSVPPGLAQLQRVISAIDSQLRGTPDCAALPTGAP